MVEVPGEGSAQLTRTAKNNTPGKSIMQLVVAKQISGPASDLMSLSSRIATTMLRRVMTVLVMDSTHFRCQATMDGVTIIRVMGLAQGHTASGATDYSLQLGVCLVEGTKGSVEDNC